MAIQTGVRQKIGVALLDNVFSCVAMVLRSHGKVVNKRLWHYPHVKQSTWR